MEGNYSLSDIASIVDGKTDGMLGGSGGAWWIIILFLFVFMSGGNGLFGKSSGSCATTEDVQNQFNFSALERQMNEGRAETIASEANITNAVKDVAYTNLTSIKGVEAAVAQLAANQNMCCCETQKLILQSDANNDRNTCAITSAIHAEGEQTRALITENTIQCLRDKVQELSLAQSQCNQNAYLTGLLRPYPNPAYVVCNPNGCGCAGTTF